jgi:hypothetical protein
MTLANELCFMLEQNLLADQRMAESSRTTSPTEVMHASRSRTVYIVLIACALPLLILVCLPLFAIAVDAYNAKRGRQQLLHETNHHALLAASRKLMRDYAGQDIADPAQDPRVPRIIRDLGPSYMDISAEQLRVELHGGFDHYGFVAFAEGVDFDDGWEKLIDGLCYYTE